MKNLTGLTNQQVQEQIQLGHVNISPKPLVKTNGQIIREHVFNLFNAYNFAIAVALIWVQAWSSLFFVVIVGSNTVIRIIQDIRSRNMVAKLTLLVSPKVKVVRDNQILVISHEEIVLGDNIYLESGNQIAADAIVLDTPVEVDESLLTGEVDPILKQVGDHLLSGSFIISGACHAEVEHVGIDNYATHIADEARKRKPVTSELIKTFTKVTKFTSMLVVPISILMLFQALSIREETMAVAIVNTSTALLGMLPKGLILLTSVSLAASVVRLGKKEVLVQEMFSIETLSRIDVLCLDKTGTLTQGKMKVQDVIPLDNTLPYSLDDIMSSFVNGSLDNNATFQTLNEYFKGNSVYKTKERVSFSSARKWSALELDQVGTIIVGAPEFIIPNLTFSQEVEEAKQNGARVLLIAYYQDFKTFQDHLEDAIPLAVILIQDPLREDAKETLQFFKDNEVQVKVISGDNPTTVSALARLAGIEDSDKYIDATTLKTDADLEDAILNYNVIGRATPYQKHQMILALQAHKLKVAMTGDGVNDVLALKDADVSIAMGSGTEATRQISQFVVINGKLATLVDVVREGRLDINNVTRSASMYYLKTIYTILIAIAAIILNMPYPFIPFQMTLMDNFIEGFPSFMILFEKNIEKPKESIGRHAMRFSLPNALTVVLSVVLMKILSPYLGLALDEVFTILYFSTFMIGLHMIYRIYKPLNWYRGLVLIIDIILFIAATWILWPLLQMASLNLKLIQYILIVVVIGAIIAMIISKIVEKYLDKEKPI
ncbi:MAG: HAD-IC family P-type ATPase [Coprobacillus sp.]